MKINLLFAAFLSSVAVSALAETVPVKRVAAVPLGAEITGLTMHNGDLFMNYQHPNEDLSAPYNLAGVGVIPNANFNADALLLPEGEAKNMVTSSLGAWQLLLSAGDDGLGVINGETSDSPDFNSFISTGENEGYLFTNWEERPGGMSRVHLVRNADGTWTRGAGEMIDFSNVNGTWINCFGSTSPWNTPLSAEELYFDNTADWNNEASEDQAGVANAAKASATYPNPYDSGFIVEITDPTGTPTPVKHKSMGRFSHENAYVMPDQKTVYLSDDGTGTVFFKFIADEAANLSAGTLFAAKFTQNGDAGIDVKEASFDIEWIELGHGDNKSIEAWVREYDGITPANYKDGASNYISDDEIAAWAKGEAKDNRAAFLESRKAAAAKGATAEFRKMEGVAYNGEYVYLAMTEIGKTMSDEEGDIQLAKNPCGAVFKITVDAEYNATKMEPFVVGGPYDETAAPNSCAVDSISSPDNVIALADGSVLIGEDSGDHENNMLWLAK